MMATEATPETIATSSITPDNDLDTETPSQDVSSDKPVQNGNIVKDAVKVDTDHVEPNSISAEVSISGGSDTEASKAETSKTLGEEKGHVRTASTTVKKFASFKPVSVNKTFLAAKGATPAAPSKLGDKGTASSAAVPAGPSTSATPRPRLVAKSGSGLRDSAPRAAAAGNGGKTGAAPDGSAVWNKNRPAAPPKPERFTDEELQQKFGIHLTTRLQSDDVGKQANWADIDDDDDDWAPEAIEWTDGTKVSLPQADETPPPPPEPALAVIAKDIEPVDVPKTKSPAPLASASPTVKPSGFGGGRAGLVLKGASEKPTLVAKPPGPPTPVKSPWASLPPVEKAPVAIEPPLQQQQQQQSRFGQRDPHGFHGMPPPPAKEIAADDFSRSWRESSHTNNQLYNSQSGRYEPVNDNRRGSVRNDARVHQPAVLQRPSNDGGPAEPSAAFQTHRAGQDGGYPRRRTSSNVSGGSGFMRRMSRGHDMPPPQNMLNVRRGSLAAVSDAPSSPRNFSPSGMGPGTYQNQKGYQQAQSNASPVVSHPSPRSNHRQSLYGDTAPVIGENLSQAKPPRDPAPDEDSNLLREKLRLEQVKEQENALKEQAVIMRQTREQARKRRQEEEAAEEAARKERIRLKLEAMGPPPEDKKKKETPKLEKSIPTQIQARDHGVAQATPSAVESNAAKVNTAETKSGPAGSPIDGKSPKQQPSREPYRPNGAHQNQMQPNASTSQENKPSPAQTWQNNSVPTPDRFKPWAQAPAAQAARNVWGPPTNDRTLGNGTFNPDLSRLPDMQQSSQPEPIGPPNRANSQFQQGRGREPYASRPPPIGPPNRQQQPLSRQDQANKAAVAASGWGSLPQTLARNEAEIAQKREQEIAQRRELEEKGLAPEAVAGPVIKDTWRKVALKEDGSRSKVQANLTTVHDTQPWKSQPEKLQEEVATRGIFEEQDVASRLPQDNIGVQPFTDGWRPANLNQSPPVRGSRFFPNNRDVRLEENRERNAFERPGSPSPPPPTMLGHPVYDGDSARPQVTLPRPPPVVRLPPTTVLAPIGPPKPVSFAAAVQAPAVPLINNISGYGQRLEIPAKATHKYQDVRRQEPQPPTAGEWKDRISALIGRKQSPPKSSLDVDSSSKNALELPPHQLAAVSLPYFNAGFVTDDESITSKPASEECFEEQEMGSSPFVKVPHKVPDHAWELAPVPKTLPKKFQVQTTSYDGFYFSQQIMNNTATVEINIPGLEKKVVNYAVPPKNRRGGSNRGGSRNPSSSSHRGGRIRDSGFPTSGSDNASVSTTHTSNRGRGRGYGTNWNRHVPTPVHT